MRPGENLPAAFISIPEQHWLLTKIDGLGGYGCRRNGDAPSGNHRGLAGLKPASTTVTPSNRA
jgi:hypothetical protein